MEMVAGMNKEDIIRFGEQADEAADRKIAMRGEYHPDWHMVRDEAFAALVAAEKDKQIYAICELAHRTGVTTEREACARMFDGEVWAYDYREIAAAIRARGEA